MLVSSVMHPNPIRATPDCTAAEASRMLSRHHIGALPVVDAGGRLRGIVTDRDILLRCVAVDSDPTVTTLRELMTRGVAIAYPDEDVRDAAARMSEHQIRRLPVIHDRRLIGMLSLADLALVCRQDAARALEQVSRPLD